MISSTSNLKESRDKKIRTRSQEEDNESKKNSRRLRQRRASEVLMTSPRNEIENGKLQGASKYWGCNICLQ